MSLEKTNLSIPSNSSRTIPEGYPADYRIAATVLHAIIFILGVFGNVCVVIVVRRTPSMRTPTYFYLVSLAIADLVVLVSALPEAIYSYQIYKRQWSSGRVGCSLWVFANFVGINVSSTSILCFTVERYIGICKPLLAQKMCTTARARRIILATWLFGILYSSPWLFLTQTSPYPDHPEMEYCHYRLTRNEYVYFYLADILLFYILPLLASVTLYVRIAVALRISILHTPGKVTISRSDSPVSNSCLLSRSLLVNSQHAWRKHVDTCRNTDEGRAVIQVVQMLFVIVLLFATLWFPYRALLVFNSIVSKPYLNLWYLLFAKTTVFINSAINPLLYNAMSKRFRRAFLILICCFKKGGSPEPTWMNLSASTSRVSRLQRSTSRSTSEVSYYASSVGLQLNGPYRHQQLLLSKDNHPISVLWMIESRGRTHSQTVRRTQAASTCRRSSSCADFQQTTHLKPPFFRP